MVSYTFEKQKLQPLIHPLIADTPRHDYFITRLVLVMAGYFVRHYRRTVLVIHSSAALPSPPWEVLGMNILTIKSMKMKYFSMNEQRSHNCSNCGASSTDSELIDGACPNCDEQILSYLGPSRGSAAEILAEERATAETEEEADFYRALLHLLACNLFTKKEVSAVIHRHVVSENVAYVLSKAYENAEETSDGDVLVCPNCEAKINSQACWFADDHQISINPERQLW
jgi:DNA-directed RNA polymerase subunit RPC12/RpoP